MKWIVFKQLSGITYTTYGPIVAETAYQACDDLARGNAQMQTAYGDAPTYVAQERGRYFAVPLDDWHDGAHDFTKSRGTEAVFSDVRE